MNKAIQKRVVEQFKSRLHAQTMGKTFNPRSQKHQNRQADFFTGAMAALIAVFEQSPDDIAAIFKEAGATPGYMGPTPNSLKLLHGKAMPPSWVFGLMRGDDLTAEPKEEKEAINIG